jgi:hypothetical protein
VRGANEAVLRHPPHPPRRAVAPADHLRGAAAISSNDLGAWTIGVFIIPGSIEFARMPERAYSANGVGKAEEAGQEPFCYRSLPLRRRKPGSIVPPHEPLHISKVLK